jgi:hypothetical protein
MTKGFFLSFSGLLLSIGLCLAPTKSETTGSDAPLSNSTTTPAKLNSLAPVEQARLLLRKIYLTGKVGSELATLDAEFERRVGQACAISRDQMRNYLNRIHIAEWEVGGNLDLPLSSVKNADGTETTAKYMVIHDTSYPRYGTSFPSNMNDESWEWNRLGRWVANVTHIYVNRIGDSKTMTPFQEGKTATKLEKYVLGEGATKGLYLHIELIQPRKFMKGYGRHNDVDAPEPGFTDAQYQRLALLYTIASVRKGEYLIPAFHACVDSGIRYAHDDPQNFDLSKFFNALTTLWTDIERNSGTRIGSE